MRIHFAGRLSSVRYTHAPSKDLIYIPVAVSRTSSVPILNSPLSSLVEEERVETNDVVDRHVDKIPMTCGIPANRPHLCLCSVLEIKQGVPECSKATDIAMCRTIALQPLSGPKFPLYVIANALYLMFLTIEQSP